MHIREFDAGGAWLYAELRPLDIRIDAEYAAKTRLGHRAGWGFDVHFDEEIAVDLNLITG